MSKLQKGTLLFEDMQDGTICFRADYHDGFSERSHSHQLMNQIIMWMDEQAATRELVPMPNVPVVGQA
jgi:hypothetical protein